MRFRPVNVIIVKLTQYLIYTSPVLKKKISIDTKITTGETVVYESSQ